MNENFSRSLSRLAAVQILYALDSKSELTSPDLNMEEVIKTAQEYHRDLQKQEEAPKSINSKFLKRLVTLVAQNLNEIDSIIASNLKEDNKNSKINILLNSILRSGVCEILHFKTPTKVTIDEYVKITKKFFDAEEAGFVNALLDKVGKASPPKPS
jgi:N utilization substance protein B